MREKEKRRILMIIFIGIIVIWGIIIFRSDKGKEEVLRGEGKIKEEYVDVLEDGTKLNTSNKLNETKEIEGLEISGIQLTHRNGKTVILAKVENKTGIDIGLTGVEITLYDDKKNELEKVEGLIAPVKAGESVQLNVGVSADYANAYDFSIEKKK